MDFNSITNRLGDITRALKYKGYVETEAYFYITEGASHISITHKTHHAADRVRETLFREKSDVTLHDLLLRAESYAFGLPNADEEQRKEFMKRLFSVAEWGKSIGIEDEIINPIAALGRKLAENVIEHKPRRKG